VIVCIADPNTAVTFVLDDFGAKVVELQIPPTCSFAACLSPLPVRHLTPRAPNGKLRPSDRPEAATPLQASSSWQRWATNASYSTAMVFVKQALLAATMDASPHIGQIS